MSGAVAGALAAILVAAAAGCSSPPKLKMVDPSAVEKPVNTPEGVAELRQKHGECGPPCS